MKKAVFFISILNLAIFTSCNATAIPKQISANINEKEVSEIKLNTGAHNLEDTTYFTLVQNFIRETGDSSKVDISSKIDGGLFVTYYKVVIDSMQISIDHSDRIYMSLNNQHYGNMLKKDGTIQAEIIYGVPDKNPEETKIKEDVVLSYYERLINIASQHERR
jgi:hypothetical protein